MWYFKVFWQDGVISLKKNLWGQVSLNYISFYFDNFLLYISGGKPDDITVVIAKVTSLSEFL